MKSSYKVRSIRLILEGQIPLSASSLVQFLSHFVQNLKNHLFTEKDPSRLPRGY